MPEGIPTSDPSLSIPALGLAIIGLAMLIIALTQLRQRRLLSAAFQSSMATIFICSGISLFLLAMNLHSYQRLSHEQAIAQIGFSQLGPQRFMASIEISETDKLLSYELAGDEWQLDARIVKWKPPATLLGMNARYRLERLSGRYRDIEQERNSQRSVHTLAQDQGLDLWTLLGKLKKYLPWVDAYYGSATFLPMADGSRYEVSLSQSGLLARPINKKAGTAINEWF